MAIVPLRIAGAEYDTVTGTVTFLVEQEDFPTTPLPKAIQDEIDAAIPGDVAFIPARGTVSVKLPRSDSAPPTVTRWRSGVLWKTMLVNGSWTTPERVVLPTGIAAPGRSPIA